MKIRIPIILLFFSIITLSIGCANYKDDGGMGPDVTPIVDLGELRQGMAIHIADHSVLPAYQDLQSKAVSLNNAAEIFNADMSAASLTGLQDALKNLWIAWQVAAIYQFGPTESSALRGFVNIYPTDAYKIENNIQSGGYNIESLINQDARGLPALDFLVNNSNLSITEYIANFQSDPDRTQYLLDISSNLLSHINDVTEEWENSSFLDDFKSEISNGTDVGSAIGILINSIDLHFQRFLRDGKVAIPAGIRSAGVTRVKATEANFGGYSGELLIAGLTAYTDLFSGVGVDDVRGNSLLSYLLGIEREQIGLDLIDRLNSATELARGLNNNFAEQIEADNEAMINTFLALQDVLTVLKSDVASVIGITITNQDNDGD